MTNLDNVDIFALAFAQVKFAEELKTNTEPCDKQISKFIDIYEGAKFEMINKNLITND